MSDTPDQAPGPKLRMGGMAMRNGLLVHGPTHWAIAARTAAGEVEVASGLKPRLARGRLATTPILRGPLRLAEALAVLPMARLGLRSSRLPYEDPAVVAAVAGSIVATGVARRLTPAGARRELAIAGLGVLPALAALRDPDLAAYHGAEHKAIAGYETDRDPADVPKEHRRCGSNLIGPLVAFGIVAQLAAEKLTPHPSVISRGAASLLAAGAAVELFAYADRNPESGPGRAVHGLGHEIQARVSTREPSTEQLEVAEAAINELLRVEGAPADRD